MSFQPGSHMDDVNPAAGPSQQRLNQLKRDVEAAALSPQAGTPAGLPGDRLNSANKVAWLTTELRTQQAQVRALADHVGQLNAALARQAGQTRSIELRLAQLESERAAVGPGCVPSMPPAPSASFHPQVAAPIFSLSPSSPQLSASTQYSQQPQMQALHFGTVVAAAPMASPALGMAPQLQHASPCDAAMKQLQMSPATTAMMTSFAAAQVGVQTTLSPTVVLSHAPPPRPAGCSSGAHTLLRSCPLRCTRREEARGGPRL